jgi:hypothetical protein
MTTAPFKVGDHVKARTSGVVPAGTPGTIVQALLSVWDMFYVQFDGYAQPQLMRASELQLADGTSEAV